MCKRAHHESVLACLLGRGLKNLQPQTLKNIQPRYTKKQQTLVRQIATDDGTDEESPPPCQRPMKDSNTTSGVPHCICVLHLFLASNSRNSRGGDEGNSSWCAASLLRVCKQPPAALSGVTRVDRVEPVCARQYVCQHTARRNRLSHAPSIPHTSGSLTATPGSPSRYPPGRDHGEAPSLPGTTPRARGRRPG